MPDAWLDVDAAVEVQVNLLPLIDNTDFKTIEEAIAYNEAGMDLNWNFITSAGVVSQTNVVPTTAGDYDWAHVGNGIYKIEIPASGGASINNDTEGYGWFTGICTGVLTWTSPRYGFRAAATNNALCDGALEVGLLDDAVTNAKFDQTTAWPANEAIVTYKLDHLVFVADADDPVDNSIMAKLAASDGDWSGFSAATDALEALRDRGDAAWITAVGFSTHSAANVWAVGTRALTDKAGFGLANDAITSAKYDESTAFPVKSDDAGATQIARTGADADTLETLSDQIDTISAAAIADAVWDESSAAHVAAGSTGKALADLVPGSAVNLQIANTPITIE